MQRCECFTLDALQVSEAGIGLQGPWGVKVVLRCHRWKTTRVDVLLAFAATPEDPLTEKPWVGEVLLLTELAEAGQRPKGGDRGCFDYVPLEVDLTATDAGVDIGIDGLGSKRLERLSRSLSTLQREQVQ